MGKSIELLCYIRLDEGENTEPEHGGELAEVKGSVYTWIYRRPPWSLGRLGVLFASRLGPREAAKSIGISTAFLRWLKIFLDYQLYSKCGLLVNKSIHVSATDFWNENSISNIFYFSCMYQLEFSFSSRRRVPMWAYTCWNMRVSLPHLWVNEKVNFQLIRWGVGDEEAFFVADSAKSRESGRKKKKKSSEMWIGTFPDLPICVSSSIACLGPQASFKMKMRVLSQASEIKCAIYTWGQGN